MKRKIAAALSALMLLSSTSGLALAATGEDYVTMRIEERADMSARERAAMEKFNALYAGAKVPEGMASSELYAIENNLLYGDIYSQGQLTDREREMIGLVALATLGTENVLRTHVYSALNAGLTPEEITDAVYHSAPYVGAAKALEAVAVVNDVFKEKGLTVRSTATVTEENRWEKGKAAQTALFGDLGDTAPKPGETRLGRSYLPDYCFGDFYTRDALTLEEHELLTWVAIASLGGQEGQLKGHTTGNKNAGRSKEYMLEVATVCMPYLGYPRTLSALAAINAVYAE